MMLTSACRSFSFITIVVSSFWTGGALGQDQHVSDFDTTLHVDADTVAFARSNALEIRDTQVEAVAATIWRIMPLGDSITKGSASAGSSPEGGYRDDLSALLKKEGVTFDFVGSQTTGSGFDRNHEGHSGKTADYIDANVTGYLQARNPQVVLLHIGTNDISQDETPASTANEIAAIIDKIRSYNSSTMIVLCSVVPRKDNLNAQNDDLAQRIEDLYYEKRSAGYRIFYAGQNEIFTNHSGYETAYLHDGVHPNNTGYNVMAGVYFNNLLTALNAGHARITDNFDRKSLGKTWIASLNYSIETKHLQNDATTAAWDDLAVYAAQTNPDAVSIRWSLAADASGIGQGGLALRLNKAATDASGYLVYIDNEAMLQLWTIEGGTRGELVQVAASGMPAPGPGDVFRVSMRSDASGHYFDYYLNDLFAGQLADFTRQLGNGSRLFAGVMLRGGANNAVDDLVFDRSSAPVTPLLALTSPNGGQNWPVGSQQNLTWSSQGSISQVKLEFSSDGGANWVNLIASTANDGNHSWEVPNTVSNQCLIRISDAADGDPVDASNQVFSIIEAGASSNHALLFDGTSDYVEIPDNAALSGGAGKSITVETWIKSEAVNGTRPIVEKFLDNGTKDWGMQIYDGAVEVEIESNGDNWGLSAGTVAAGVWAHLAFTFDNSANRVKLYVNGVLAGQQGLSKDMPDTRAVIRLGRHGYASSYFGGEMDDMRIWNYARSVTEISASMNNELFGNENGLIAYWNFNEGTGQIAGDLSRLGNNGRLGSSSSVDAGDPNWVLSTTSGGDDNAPLLQITAPNGGESWQVGSVQAIRWNSQGTIDAMRIDFSADNGGSWTTIASGTSNDGQHNWTLPNAVSSQCLVRIADASDADLSDVSNSVFFIVSGSAATRSFQPVHDVYVRSSTPTSKYGSLSTLRVRKSSSEVLASYLKFDVGELGGPVQNAILRLYVTDASPDGGAIYSVSNNYNGTSEAWTQSGLNWNNAPAISGTALSTAGAASLNSWVEFDVTAAITGNGTFSFGMKSNASDLVYYSSKESSSNKPQLVIQTSGGAISAAPQEDLREAAVVPDQFELSQNYPNPFNPETQIEYDVPFDVEVRLAVYNILGREVAVLVAGEQLAGRHSVMWNGRSSDGQQVSAGTYFCRLQAGSFVAVRKMLLLQ